MNLILIFLAAVFALGSLIATDVEQIFAGAAPAPTPSPRKIRRVPASTRSPVTTNANLKPTANEISIESRKKKRRRTRSNR
jgi:hypothetical protein